MLCGTSITAVTNPAIRSPGRSFRSYRRSQPTIGRKRSTVGVRGRPPSDSAGRLLDVEAMQDPALGPSGQVGEPLLALLGQPGAGVAGTVAAGADQHGS